VKSAVEKFQAYLNRPAENRHELFDEVKKVSLQVALHKIPNLINDKQILCKLPHPIVSEANMPEVCLIVKDVAKKERDYERTVRKYAQLLKSHELDGIVKRVVPLKQLNLEFRPFEAKRALSTSYDLFLADKCLHEILFGGSKLGKEFHKRRKMPIEIDVENCKDLKQTVMDVLNSTVIRFTGKGAIIDVSAFLSSQSVEEALANIGAIRATLAKQLPGGEANVKAIYLKSTNAPAVPIYAAPAAPGELKLPSNMSLAKKRRAKADVKRLATAAAKPKKAKKAATKKTIVK